MRLASLLGVLLGCGLWPWAAQAEPDHTVSLSVVQIRAYAPTGRMFLGSGVVVGADRVATNCHVTRDAERILVSKGALNYPATSQRANTRHDLCLLAVPGIAVPAAKLGEAGGLSVGQPLHFYGYPRGIGIAFAEARVRALHPFEGGRVIETTADFTFGGSGGGLFDEQGRLVGLATFLSAAQSQGYAIPVDWIATLERGQANNIGPLQGVAFWEDKAELPSFLKPPGP
jgi:S1-C subfamily serine protease